MLHPEEMIFVPLSPRGCQSLYCMPSVRNYVIIVPYPKLPKLNRIFNILSFRMVKHPYFLILPHLQALYFKTRKAWLFKVSE